jgi:hypothetical protein
MNRNPLHAKLSDGQKIDNNDMDMGSQSLRVMESHVCAAMQRKKIKNAFYHFEAEANRIKRWHNILGTFGLVLLVVVLEFTLAKLLAIRFDLSGMLKPFIGIVVMLGTIPGACAALIYVFRLRERWLLARFKAERIRHWKFQQLLDGPHIESLQTERIDADHVWNVKWQKLIDELNAGKGRMHDYVRNLPFSSPFVHHHPFHPYTSETIFINAASVYEQFRLNVQLNWFNQESEQYQQSDRRTETIAETLLLLSVGAAFLEGALHFLPILSHNRYIAPGLSFLAVSMAVASAGVRVYRSASGISESAERYRRLASQLHWYRETFSRILDKETHDSSSQEELFEVMVEIERLCHGELVEFIRVAAKSDYFF